MYKFLKSIFFWGTESRKRSNQIK